MKIIFAMLLAFNIWADTSFGKGFRMITVLPINFTERPPYGTRVDIYLSDKSYNDCAFTPDSFIFTNVEVVSATHEVPKGFHILVSHDDNKDYIEKLKNINRKDLETFFRKLCYRISPYNE